MDGVATPEEYVNRAVELGMPALAITDHGSLSGHRELHRIAKAKGIKPILGVEGYMTRDMNDKRAKAERTDPLDLNYHHIVLLAKNQTGLENLNKINEIAWTEGFFSKPRFDFDVLKKYKEGLIVTSGCLSGWIAKAVELGELATAKRHMQWFKDEFKNDYYIEVMPHNSAEINKGIIELADAMKIKIVVTPDCHHSDPSQKEIQELMLILNTHAKLEKDATYDKSKKKESFMDRLDYLYGADRMMSFIKFDIHLLSYDEMKDAMLKQGIDREDMFTSTIEIANKIEDYDIKEGLNLLPVQYPKPGEELKKLSLEGLKERGLDGKQEYLDRLDEELTIINNKNFVFGFNFLFS